MTDDNVTTIHICGILHITHSTATHTSKHYWLTDASFYEFAVWQLHIQGFDIHFYTPSSSPNHWNATIEYFTLEDQASTAKLFGIDDDTDAATKPSAP